MKNSKERREQAVANYKKAYELFTKGPGHYTWRTCLEKCGCDKKYPFMNLDKISKRCDVDLVISDLIGFVGRMGWQSGNSQFVEAVTEVMTETRVDVHNIEAFSDAELCIEFNKRGLHEENGEFFKLEILKKKIFGGEELG